jgi:hypothetical protein
MSNSKTPTTTFNGLSTVVVTPPKGKAPTNNVKPALDRKDSGTRSKLKKKASREDESLPKNSKAGAQSSPLERTETGAATLGIEESDEEVEKSGGEEVGSRSSGRSGRGRRKSEKVEREGRAEMKSREKRPETKPREKESATKSRSKPTPLTKAALSALPTRQSKSAPKPKIKRQKPKRPAKIEFYVDIKRKALVRKGIYDDGTKPWKDRFGDPDVDLFETVARNKVFRKVKKHLWLFF